MGYWSDKSIPEMEGPNLVELEKFVCEDCVVDDALMDLVRSNLEAGHCDYCGAQNKIPIAASFNVVMRRIYEAISTKYADAQDIDLPWVEGGWLTEEIYAVDVVGDFDPGWSGEFVEDVINCLDPFAYWTEHTHGDWSISNPRDTLRFGWEGFKTQVLTKTRYLFLSEPEDDVDSGRPDYLPISRTLEALGDVLRRHSPSVVLEPRTKDFYRVRVASPGESWSSFEQLGVPPIGNASAGRMNPPGIPYFYLATDADTATAEVVRNKTRYFIAKFVATQPLRLINLIDRPEYPSLFLPELFDERHEIGFLYDFVSDITEPVAKDGTEHVEYVPTQIVAEYLRYRFRDSEGKAIDGLLYPSVKSPGGQNMVIFESTNELLKDVFDLVSIEEC